MSTSSQVGNDIEFKLDAVGRPSNPTLQTVAPLCRATASAAAAPVWPGLQVTVAFLNENQSRASLPLALPSPMAEGSCGCSSSRTMPVTVVARLSVLAHCTYWKQMHIRRDLRHVRHSARLFDMAIPFCKAYLYLRLYTVRQ